MEQTNKGGDCRWESWQWPQLPYITQPAEMCDFFPATVVELHPVPLLVGESILLQHSSGSLTHYNGTTMTALNLRLEGPMGH